MRRVCVCGLYIRSMDAESYWGVGGVWCGCVMMQDGNHSLIDVRIPEI